jgi:hypothetical protein
MSDEHNRATDWAALLAAWPAAQPPRGFADRVILACQTESAARAAPPLLVVRAAPPARRWACAPLLLSAALAAALVLIPLALQRRQASSSPHPTVATVPSFDLGSD